MLLAAADRRLGICAKLAAKIADRRNPDRVVHLLPDILRARILAIACGFGMPTISTGCAAIRRSSWPAIGFPTAAAICARNRRCRVGRTRRACAN